MITKEDFDKYVKLQHSGIINMCAVNSVSRLTGLTIDQCIDIMKNYSKYKEKFNVGE